MTIDNPFDLFELLSSPTNWPLWARRAFIILFPITAPLWFIWVGLLTILLVLMLITSGIMIGVMEMWQR